MSTDSGHSLEDYLEALRDSLERAMSLVFEAELHSERDCHTLDFLEECEAFIRLARVCVEGSREQFSDGADMRPVEFIDTSLDSEREDSTIRRIYMDNIRSGAAPRYRRGDGAEWVDLRKVDRSRAPEPQ